MAKGPCLCGDPACGSCGSPGAAELEAAEEWLMDTLNAEKLSAAEYKLVAEVGLAAVKVHRELCNAAIEEAVGIHREALQMAYWAWQNGEPVEVVTDAVRGFVEPQR